MPTSSLNVAEWSPKQVADWLTGLGPSVSRYVPALAARGVDGARLLALRCDDLEYLGVRSIGHQELVLEAVEHLRNFQYEVKRECVQQLALRVSVVATTLTRTLAHHADKGLETQILADVARTVYAVKPLVCWLDRWALCSRGATPCSRRSALLRAALQAATSAMRERFAEQPARLVAAAASAAMATADYIVQDVSDPMVLQPASLDTVTLRQGSKPLGFDVVPSFCGHHQLADIRFGSPAHASGAIHIGDEIVQVGSQCVIGWSGAAVLRLCAEVSGAPAGELALRVRRRAARAPPALATPQLLRVHRLQRRRPPHLLHDHFDSYRCELSPLPASPPPVAGAEAEAGAEAAEGAGAREESAPSSDESEPLSPPASPSHLLLDRPRLYPPKPRAAVQRRHTVCGASPLYKRPAHLDQFWQELKHQRGGHEGGSASMTPTPDEIALYARDKAASCGAGLQLAPRPRTCGALDKAQSAPAYDLGALAAQPIPESPAAPDLDKSNSQRDRERVLETINVAMMEHRRRSIVSPQQTPEPTDVPAPRFPRSSSSRAPEPPPRPTISARPSQMTGVISVSSVSSVTSVSSVSSVPSALSVPSVGNTFPVLRAVPRVESPPTSLLKPLRPIDATHMSAARAAGEAAAGGIVLGAHAPAGAARGMFPTSKSRSLKKNTSLLAKRRLVPARALAARGALGAVWQRVRARGAPAARWVRRHLLLTHNLLYAYRTPDCAKADCMIYLEGCTVAAAGEVKSRPHAFKVYHTGCAFYFACDSRDAALGWLQLIHRATLLPSLAAHMDVSKQFSETDYSETESDTENPQREKDREREKEKDKSKFGSLKKLTVRMQRSESHENVPHSSTSLDRKYLRFFSRNKNKDEDKNKSAKSKQSGVPVPTEHYRSYRKAPVSEPSAPPPAPLAAEGEGRPRRMPKPINYIHASNPNLLDFDKSDFVTKPALHVPKPKPKPESLSGLVTLEQFMLRKQAEERRLARDRRLDGLVPDVIYGEVGPADDAPSMTRRRDEMGTTSTPGSGKPISVRGKDGYEKIVYRDEVSSPRPTAHDRWRDSLRRNDKVHNARGTSPEAPPALDRRGPRLYAHLQCPPTFQPESYSLARPPARRARPPDVA